MDASEVCRQHAITLQRAALDLLEIQSDNGEAIARHKAAAAFEALQTPLVVSDDSWTIPGLNGFPGPYMKYVNDWFTPTDFWRLTVELDDRRIMLRQIVVYQDATEQIAFSVDTPGVLLKTIRGVSNYPHLTITSLDGRQSLAEVIVGGSSGLAGVPTVWLKVCDWLNSRDKRP